MTRPHGLVVRVPGPALVLLMVGCTHPPQYDVMSAQVVCDTLPAPVRPGERVGGTLPSALRPGLDSVVVIGTVLEAGSGRPLSGANIGLLATAAPDRSDQSIARAVTNSEAGFMIVAPRPGPYSVVAYRIGYAAVRRDVALAAGKVTTVQLEMQYRYCPGY